MSPDPPGRNRPANALRELAATIARPHQLLSEQTELVARAVGTLPEVQVTLGRTCVCPAAAEFSSVIAPEPATDPAHARTRPRRHDGRSPRP